MIKGFGSELMEEVLSNDGSFVVQSLLKLI